MEVSASGHDLDLSDPPGVPDITDAEREIDHVLADSFPASDPPPWTLGVEPARTE